MWIAVKYGINMMSKDMALQGPGGGSALYITLEPEIPVRCQFQTWRPRIDHLFWKHKDESTQPVTRLEH